MAKKKKKQNKKKSESEALKHTSSTPIFLQIVWFAAWILALVRHKRYLSNVQLERFLELARLVA